MNSVLQFIYIIVLLFTIGNADAAVNSRTGLPLIEVYYEATNSKHATNLFVVMVAIVVFIGTFNIYASVSRLTWAFARDKGLPFSSFFAKVSFQ
jgi:amino acid transporter